MFFVETVSPKDADDHLDKAAFESDQDARKIVQVVQSQPPDLDPSNSGLDEYA